MLLKTVFTTSVKVKAIGFQTVVFLKLADGIQMNELSLKKLADSQHFMHTSPVSKPI